MARIMLARVTCTISRWTFTSKAVWNGRLITLRYSPADLRAPYLLLSCPSCQHTTPYRLTALQPVVATLQCRPSIHPLLPLLHSIQDSQFGNSMNMFRLKSPINNDAIDGTLPVLPLPAGSVLLPSSSLAVQLFRQDSLNMLEAVLDEADKKGNPNNAIVAAVSFRMPPSASSKALVRKADGGSSPKPKGGVSSSNGSPLTVNTGKQSSASGDNVKPSVNQLSECTSISLHVFIPAHSDLALTPSDHHHHRDLVHPFAPHIAK